MNEITSEYLQILNDYIKVGVKEGSVIDYEELSIVLDSFWTTEYDNLTEKIKNFNGLKTIHYGLIPKNPEEYIKRSSLYSDLIILEAPLDSSFKRLYGVAGEKLLRLNEIKDWIDEGIVILIPSVTLQKSLQYNSVQYLNTMQTLMDNDLGDNIFKNILDDIYNDALEIKPSYSEEKYALYAGGVFKLNDHLMSMGILNATLTAHDKFNWKLLMRKLENDQKLLGKDNLSFAALNKVNVKFLDNVTLDFARKIRKEGYLSELRSYFRETFAEIQKTPDESEFYDIVNNYSIEIFDQVKMHEREWENIKKEAVEKCGIKGSFALSTGTICGMASFGLGIPAWIGFLGGVLISSKYTIKDIVDEYLEFRKKRRDLQRKPIHLLYELKTA
jgi:hypothetical protein